MFPSFFCAEDGVVWLWNDLKEKMIQATTILNLVSVARRDMIAQLILNDGQ